ncbi:MAG: hypothetical protein QM761_09320 [Pseudoxanthomonas sp.]
MSQAIALKRATWMFALLAVALLAMTLAWHIPMMLWDHLDLVPMYQAWRERGLADAGLWQVHDGSHLHAGAYYVLLATTALSHGRPWLDCLASFALLLGFAALALRMARATFLQRETGAWAWFGLVFLALTPGHLPNLQWGWQVAVFLCLFGAGVCIQALGTGELNWRRNVVALAGAMLACISFSTALALIPAALLLIALRRESPLAMRGLHALPWLALAAYGAWRYGALAVPGETGAGPLLLGHYALNFLGGGAARFARHLGVGVTALALLASWPLLRAGLWRREALPWLGLIVFGAGSAVLTALGRAAPFGAEHAFASRYVSFSSMFWLGWLGLFWSLRADLSPWARRWLTRLAMLLTVLIVANGLQMAKKAARTGKETRETASLIRQSWPQVDDATLAKAYFGRTDLAVQRLQALRAYGFAPFDPAQAEPETAPAQTPR